MPRATHNRPASRTHGTAVRFSMPFPLFFRALHLMLAFSSGVSKCFLGFQGSRKDFAQQKLCGIISGLPQKSHGEFCGKRSGRRIRSCGKRSAPQTKPPCRDEVGSLPLANFGMPHCSGHSLTEAQVLLRETVSGEEGARRRGCRPRSPAALSRARSAIARPLTALRLSPSLPPKKAKKRAGMLACSFFTKPQLFSIQARALDLQ